MRKQEAKTVKQTFSLPKDLSWELHAYVKSRERSRFVAEAIRNSLAAAKKTELRNAYLEANRDEAQLEVMEEWQCAIFAIN